jgi:hypothetical protein
MRAGCEQAERGRIDFVFRRLQSETVSDGFREPPAQAEVFAKSVSPRRGTRRWRGLG